MQEHTGQVRGQARAPVGRHFGGLALDWMDSLFPVWSHHTRTNLPDISTLPEASTQLTDSRFGVFVRAYVLVLMRVVSGVRVRAQRTPLHLPFSDGPSHPLLVPKKKGAMFLLDCEALPWVFLSLPPPPPLPVPRCLVFALTYYSSRTLCLDSLRKGLVKTVDLSFQDDMLLFLFNL